MALEAEKLKLSATIPAGEMSSKVIKAVHQDTRRRMFSKDSFYGVEGDKENRQLRKSIVVNLSPESRDRKVVRSHVLRARPIEKRDFSRPSKAFRTWVIPRRFSSCEQRQPTPSEVEMKPSYRSLSALSHVSKCPTIKSDDSTPQAPKAREEKLSILPRLNTRVNRFDENDLVPRTYSAAQKWMVSYDDDNHQINKVVRQFEEAKIDRILANIGDLSVRESMRKWFDKASKKERKEGIEYLSSSYGVLERSMGSTSRLKHILEQKNIKKTESSTAMEMARNRRVKLLSAATRMRMGEFQTWHHLPIQRIPQRTEDPTSMFRNLRPPPPTFRIHPEWA